MFRIKNLRSMADSVWWYETVFRWISYFNFTKLTCMLTCMLSCSDINRALNDERLCSWPPKIDPGDRVDRELLLRPHVMNRLNSIGEVDPKLWGQVRADMAHWISGGFVAEKEFLKRLNDPHSRERPIVWETWEFRFNEARPKYRLLGRFAKPDCFVGLAIYKREIFPRKATKRWRAAMHQTGRQWQFVFGAKQWHTGVSFNDYVTENTDGGTGKRYR